MKTKQKPAHCPGTRSIRVEPVFLEKPDVEKLGRALISIALNMAQEKKVIRQTHNNRRDAVGGEGDGMP